VLLSGELSQHERNQSMQALRDGRARVCVATDVAARGIDLPNLGLVIHAELPNDSETLQHRSGRTGRAGRKGVSALLVPHSRRQRAERLLMDAGVSAIWSGPPSADEIRKLDQDRLLLDPLLTEPPADEELEMAKLLLAERTPEQLGAALVRIYRSRLPALEDVTDPGPDRRDRQQMAPGKTSRKSAQSSSQAPSQSAKTAKASRAGLSSTAVLFKLNIGRTKNADPKWLLPMLCRKGNITKQDIGVIRIFDNETKIEIAETVAAQFAANMRRPGGDNIQIEQVSGDIASAPAADAPVKHRKPKSFAKEKHKERSKT
jgi:ATP-dependent RNA helicase DeaD